MILDAHAPTQSPASEAAQSSASMGSDATGAAEPDGAAVAATPPRPDSPAAAARARDAAIADSILRLVAVRGPERSICPSEAAREVAAAEGRADWHRLMGNVRRIAGRLQREGRVESLRKGRPAAADVRGVIRLRAPADVARPAPSHPAPGFQAAEAAPADPVGPA